MENYFHYQVKNYYWTAWKENKMLTFCRCLCVFVCWWYFDTFANCKQATRTVKRYWMWTTDLRFSYKFQKSFCLRIVPGRDINYSIINNATGVMINWVSELRYLRVILVKSRSFNVCLDYAKRSFSCAASAIFGKIRRLASEEVILQLIVSKYLPMLLYGLKACTLNKSQLSSRFYYK